MCVETDVQISRYSMSYSITLQSSSALLRSIDIHDCTMHNRGDDSCSPTWSVTSSTMFVIQTQSSQTRLTPRSPNSKDSPI